MSYILVGTYFGLSFIFRKNKKVAYILLTILVILSIFSGENADSNIYKARYNSADYFADFTEPIFTFLINTSNLIGLEYKQFRMILLITYFIIIFFVTMKLTKNIDFVMLLYFIFPFAIDAVQLRQTTAYIFVYLAFYILLRDGIDINFKNDKKRILLFILFICIAGNIHYSTFLYLIFLIPILYKETKKNILFITLFIVEIIIVLLMNGLINILPESNLTNKIHDVIEATNYFYGSYTAYLRTYLRVLGIFCIYMVLNGTVINNLKRNNINNEQLIRCYMVRDFNIYILLIIPFMIYFADLYRLQAGLLTLDYITLSYYYQKNNKVGDNILFKITSMVLPVFILYFYVLNNESALYVIDPLIKNSLLN